MGHWLLRLSLIVLLAFPLAVLGSRIGLYDFRLGFDIWRYALYASVAVFALGVIVALWQRNSTPLSSKAARNAALLALLPIVLLGSQLVTARSVPPIHNISTDVVNPPQFDKVVALRSEGSNPLTYDIAALAEVQQQAYPNVNTLITEDEPAVAYGKSLQIVEGLGWQLVSSDESSGIIEATETTLLWGFKDDVVIRISRKAGVTAVDLRSVSRVGVSDLGANAKRIEEFLAAYQ